MLNLSKTFTLSTALGVVLALTLATPVWAANGVTPSDDGMGVQGSSTGASEGGGTTGEADTSGGEVGDVADAGLPETGGGAANCAAPDVGSVGADGSIVAPDPNAPPGVACALPAGGGGAGVPAPVIDYPGLAYQAFVQIKFEPPAIGMAPKVNPEWGHRRTYVGLPVWMWVDSPSALSWGPYNSTHDLAGVTFRFDAQVDRIVWDMGDGTTVTCGLGDIYTPAYGNVKSPTCGHVYQHVSEDQPGGMYAVSATAYWNVNWTAGGQSGTIPLELTSSTEVEVRQLQSVNVPVDPNGG